MLLEANEITVKGEHVVHSFILETLDVDCLVLRQLDQVSDLMVIRYRELVLVSKTKIISVNSQSISVLLLHRNDIDLTESVPCFQRHEVVKGL